MIRLSTAGESHGKALVAILEGVPAGLVIDQDAIDARLAVRQSGYGRGKRQQLECDRAEILSGVRNKVTLGSPIALMIPNRDYENWKGAMAPEGCDTSLRKLTAVRPGHADLAGMQKFETDDARNVLERASARSTAIRVAAGEICRALLAELGVSVAGYVRSVGTVVDENEYTFSEIVKGRSPVLGMMDRDVERRACAFIDECAKEGDSAGGIFEVRVHGLKAGFGSCMTDPERLDARLVSALVSVQAVKGAEVGLGFEAARRKGSEAHDPIFLEDDTFVRKTNRAGGIEGGMSNGEEIVLRAAMKPIPTLMKGLPTVDTATGKACVAASERSDVCAVLACETVCEAAVCFELARAVVERLGGDTVEELKARYGVLA